jgi:hypothetical protein
MDRVSIETVRARQLDREREIRQRIWANELRGRRRSDGSLRFIRLRRH